MHATQQAKTKVPFSFGYSNDSGDEGIACDQIIVNQPPKKTIQFTKDHGAKPVKVIVVPTVQSCPSFWKAACKPWSKMNEDQELV